MTFDFEIPNSWPTSPRPWSQDPDAPWIIKDADGNVVVKFEEASDNVEAGQPARGNHTENWGNARLVTGAVNGTPVMVGANSERDMTIKQLADSVHTWADMTFPHRNDSSMIMKMFEEIGELVRSPGRADELADLFILLLDYSVRHKLDVKKIVLQKLFVNMGRTWKVDHLTGVMRHVDGGK